MATISDVKAKVREVLDGLVADGTIAEVQEDDFRVPVLARNFTAYPAAVLTTPGVDSTPLTTKQNRRVCSFSIVVVMRGDDITSAREVEDKMERVLNAFDRNQTLGGVAIGLEPSVSQPEAAGTPDRRLVVFAVVVRATISSVIT